MYDMTSPCEILRGDKSRRRFFVFKLPGRAVSRRDWTMRKYAGLIVPVSIILFGFLFASCAGKSPRDISLKDVPKSEDIENAKDVYNKNKDVLNNTDKSPETQQKPAASPEEIPHIDNGINIHLKGDRNLNRYKKSPHALILCVYQLKDLNGFNLMMEDKNGMARLMECGRFDPSVNYVKRVVVQPGKDVYESMEVAEGTKNLGIIAGYYYFNKSKAVKTFLLPKKGFFVRKPGGMDVDLVLKSNEIQEIKED
jgi:predicted component of type VI protein secretion system